MDRKRIRLWFTDTNEQISDFFIRILRMKYDITIDNENPEYLIFGDRNFGENNLTYDPNKVTKIFYTGENQRPWDYQCHYALSFEHIENERHYRLPFYVIYNSHNQTLINMKKYRGLWSLGKNKPEFCSFVVRNPTCQKRNDFFHKLSKYKQVHSGGPLFNNIGHIIEYGENAPHSKQAWLPKYKFNLCFENASYPGYATEKLMDAYCGGTIPIYWGSPTIEVDFNPRAFLNWYDYGSDEALIEAIIHLDNDEEAYRNMYKEPLFARQSNRFMDMNRLLAWFDGVIK
jgi:alpha(1,3/1,4) fucosyltransferase